MHPDLVKVIRQAAIECKQAFMVDYGLRSQQAEEEAVKTGHSETMHSRHLADAHYNGLSMAVDIVCLLPGDLLDWRVTDENGGLYGIVASTILAVAKRMGIAVQWGGQQVGAWTDGVVSHFRDWGHFQLDRSIYP